MEIGEVWVTDLFKIHYEHEVQSDIYFSEVSLDEVLIKANEKLKNYFANQNKLKLFRVAESNEEKTTAPPSNNAPRFGRYLKINTKLNNWLDNVKSSSSINYEHLGSKPKIELRENDFVYILDERNNVRLYGNVQNYGLKTIQDILKEQEQGIACGLSEEELQRAVSVKEDKGLYCTTIKDAVYLESPIAIDDFCEKYNIKNPFR